MNEKKDNPRAEIDAIDDELLRLLNERAAIALRVGVVRYKRGQPVIVDVQALAKYLNQRERGG